MQLSWGVWKQLRSSQSPLNFPSQSYQSRFFAAYFIRCALLCRYRCCYKGHVDILYLQRATADFSKGSDDTYSACYVFIKRFIIQCPRYFGQNWCLFMLTLLLFNHRGMKRDIQNTLQYNFSSSVVSWTWFYALCVQRIIWTR